MKTSIRALSLALGLLFAASAFAEAPPPAVKASATAATPASAPAAKADKHAKHDKHAKAEVPVAPGGGEGKVWVNHKSKIYHCDGSKDYGKTKDGEYMTEADAKAKGNKARAGKACDAAAKDAKPAKETKKVEKSEKAEKPASAAK